MLSCLLVLQNNQKTSSWSITLNYLHTHYFGQWFIVYTTVQRPVCANFPPKSRNTTTDSQQHYNTLLLSTGISSFSVFYYAALLPRRGPHIASHSVCPSVPLLLPSVTSRHLANYNDTHVGPHIVRPSRPHKFLFYTSIGCYQLIDLLHITRLHQLCKFFI